MKERLESQEKSKQKMLEIGAPLIVRQHIEESIAKTMKEKERIDNIKVRINKRKENVKKREDNSDRR